MRKARRKIHRKKIQKKFRVNKEINAPSVRVINEEGKHLGIFPTSEAIRMAKERDLDLIEISPKEIPPIVKFLEFGSFQYQRERGSRKQKAKLKKVEVKGIRFSPRISRHDLDCRLRQALKFLNEGNKLKIEMIVKGRERRHLDLARDLVTQFINMLNEGVGTSLITEQSLTSQGDRLVAILAKKER